MKEPVYIDNHIIVFDKPRGLVTQKTDGHKTSLEEQLKAYLKQKLDKQGAVFLHAVHRLDKDVSGLVLFAKTSKALSRMQKQMREKKIKKSYYALVEGVPSSKRGHLEDYLLHTDHCSKVVSTNATGSKLAVLNFEVEKTNINTSLLKIDLQTGRYHQIRVQLSHIGHPILGDKKYGSSHIYKKGIALHSYCLEFIHPVTQKELTLQSEPDFLKDL